MNKMINRILVAILTVFVVGGVYFANNSEITTSLFSTESNRSIAKSSVIEITNTVPNSNTSESIETTSVVEKETIVEDTPVVKEETVVEDINYEEPYYEPTYEENNDNSGYYEEPSYNRIRVGGVIDSPLMTDYTGEHFYLNHNIYGEWDGLGVPYNDFRTNFEGRKTIVYAHSSTAGNGPFQALQNYHYNSGFYYNNPYIEIDYNGNHYTYQIFSVYVSTADNDYSEGLEYFYNMDYSDSSWESTLQWYKSNSEYDTGVEVHSNDKILILQTCSMDPNYYERYYRYNLLVMGKLV